MDTILERIDRWHLKFRQYFFKYSGGFYELPFLVNSPQVMVRGLAKVPFSKYDEGKHLLLSDSPFSKSELIHLEVEDELILVLSRSEFRKNLKFKFLYDKAIPARHYFLRYQIISEGSERHLAITNGIPYSINTWLFYKPGSSPDNYYFKNTSGTFFTLYFTLDWLTRFLEGFSAAQKKGIELFLKSPQQYLMFPDESKQVDYRLFLSALANKPQASDMRLQDFKRTTYDIVASFVTSLSQGSITSHFFLLSNQERVKIMQAEKHLKKHLTSRFPGIEELAAKVGIAQSSLKKGFKLIYGRSIYKYYQHLQMQVAAERLIKNPRLSISSLSLEMGYENASKFSAAFKQHIGLTPSKYAATLG